MVNFSDAVVAIAITLLVLPLVELPAELDGRSSVLDLLRDNSYQFGSFALSFYVIGSLWRGHHRLFEYLRSYDSVILKLNMWWLLTIVFLPFATEMVAKSASAPSNNALYVGTILVSATTMAGMEFWVRRHPDLQAVNEHAEGGAEPSPINGRIWVMPLMLLLIAVVVLAIPAVGLWAMLLLLLVTPIRRYRASPKTSR